MTKKVSFPSLTEVDARTIIALTRQIPGGAGAVLEALTKALGK